MDSGFQSSSRPWFPNEKQNLLLFEKRTLDHWATVQFFFSLVQVRCLMHWLQLQFTPCEALPSVWIGFSWLYSQACGHPCYLCTFSYPISSFQSTLHLICFDTALCEEPHLSVTLWLTLFAEGVNDRLLDHCQVSSVTHYCSFKEQEIPRIYTAWMVIYWNSNVNILIFLRYWFLTFISCKLINIKTKTLLKCFTLHVMNLKYMKVSLFETSYKNFVTFSPYSNFLRCTCICVCMCVCVCVIPVNPPVFFYSIPLSSRLNIFPYL